MTTTWPLSSTRNLPYKSLQSDMNTDNKMTMSHFIKKSRTAKANCDILEGEVTYLQT